MTRVKKRICCMTMTVIIAVATMIFPVDWMGRSVIVEAAEENEFDDSEKNVMAKRYLDECTITTSDQYDDNQGDSFIYPIGRHGNSRGNTDINGVSYNHGIEAWIARWNYTPEQSWASATFDIGHFTGNLTGKCVLIDSYNTTNFDTTVYFYGDGNLLASYDMKPDNIPFSINIDMENVKELRIYVADNDYFKGGTSFGFTDMELISRGGEPEIKNDTVVYFDGGEKKSLVFDYSIDSCLNSNATIYNADLAYMLSALATSAYQKEDSSFTLLKDVSDGIFPNDALAISESLRNLGFKAESGDVREFNYFSSSKDSNYESDATAFTLATKQMNDGTKLVAIVVRGTYGASDWQSNVNFKNQGVGLHEGFNSAADKIIQELNTFRNDKSISGGSVKYVITGHSRGAAVANLVAKKLIDSGISKNNVYDYNFACPDSGRNYSSGWNPNGTYDSLYNINNVRDIIGIIPGNLFNSSLNINNFLFSDELGTVFWGKYGHTYFFAENWDTVQETMIGGIDQHDSKLYLNFMKRRYSTDSFKSWEKARAVLAANAAKSVAKKTGKIFGIFCPVDIEVIDSDGIKVAEVVNGQPHYYIETVGNVVILTAGDQNLVYLNGNEEYFVKLTGNDTGKMTYCVCDAVLGNEYGKEITYFDVSLVSGKTMVSIVDNDIPSDEITLVLLNEDNIPEKQINTNGIEQTISEELKEEYSNLPLSEKQYTISYNLNGGQVTGNPTTYTKDTETFSLKNPTKAGYTFVGWTGSNGNTTQKTVIISKGTTSDLAYVANWESTSSLDNAGGDSGTGTVTSNDNGGSSTGANTSNSSGGGSGINKKQTGWVKDGDTWHYNKVDGTTQIGWVNDGGTWYYMSQSGAMQTGWVNDGGTWYYMSQSGAMQTGWVNDGGTWYYTSGSGAMQTGWINEGGTWYYMNASGAMQTGWINVGGAWYYTSGSGAMQTGWVNDGGKWYYMDASGVMQTGWLSDGGSWYYLGTDGAMRTGWYSVGGKYYYSYESGKMAVNTKIGSYRVNAKGEWVK